MVTPDMNCMGCPFSDNHNYSTCSYPGDVNKYDDCIIHRFSNIHDRSYGEERKKTFNNYKRNPW